MSVKPVQAMNRSPHHHQHKCRTPLLCSPVMCLVGSFLVLQAFSAATVNVKAASVAAFSAAVVEESSPLLAVSWSRLHDPQSARPRVVEQSTVGVTARRLVDVKAAVKHVALYRCVPVIFFVALVLLRTEHKSIQWFFKAVLVLLNLLAVPPSFAVTWFGTAGVMAAFEPLDETGAMPIIMSKGVGWNFIKNLVLIYCVLRLLLLKGVLFRGTTVRVVDTVQPVQ
eukprot:GHVQ01002269.1.p1 GENE.GHVQ01002269.1~~GHVQ01002269.1.p1  ORF type:complete len:225 (+),score=30.48 GHVQ01002269.1:198-872(+)